ncbi:MAG: hypothetical protein R2771_00825 [Saprospiraceae bacterium]
MSIEIDGDNNIYFSEDSESSVLWYEGDTIHNGEKNREPIYSNQRSQW